MKVCETNEVGKNFINPEIKNEALGWFLNQASLDFRKIHDSLVKIYCEKQFQSMKFTCPSTVHPTYPEIHSRIMKTVNPLSQIYINRKFRKYISVSISHCHRASFMRSLFVAFKNDEWCHFVVRIGSPTETHKWSFDEWVASAFSN